MSTNNTALHFLIDGGVAEWIRRNVSNLVGYTRMGSNPIADSAGQKPAAKSAVHPSEVGKLVLRGNSEGVSRSAAGPRQLCSCLKPSLR